MATSYVRYILFKAARNSPLGSAHDSVVYFDFDQEAEAIAAGEAWLLAGASHPWFAVFGQAENGRLVRIAGEDT